MQTDPAPIKVLTWHVHGNYLYYLTQAQHIEFYLPTKKGRPEGYGGRTSSFPWGNNVKEVEAKDVKDLALDAILFQSTKNFLTDRFEILSPAQRELPMIYLEHDPPQENPTNTKHITYNIKNILLVHVTHFNQLMWDQGATPTTVIGHGVMVPPGVSYRGDLPKGIVVVNNLKARGRRLGLDVFEQVRRTVPLDLVGMDSESLGGLGNISPTELPAFVSQYRFFFNPIRYTSLGLAVCEAMLVGLPVVGLATTEMSVTVQNGVNGYASTNIKDLIEYMQQLIEKPAIARTLSTGARAYAESHFSISRFAQEWEQVIRGWIRVSERVP